MSDVITKVSSTDRSRPLPIPILQSQHTRRSEQQSKTYILLLDLGLLFGLQVDGISASNQGNRLSVSAYREIVDNVEQFANFFWLFAFDHVGDSFATDVAINHYSHKTPTKQSR